MYCKGGYAYGPPVKSTLYKFRGVPSEAVVCARSPPQRSTGDPDIVCSRADTGGHVMEGGGGEWGTEGAQVRLLQSKPLD